jgi:alpha-galactosidase/6-phospho-beta-glucosidase family protein
LPLRYHALGQETCGAGGVPRRSEPYLWHWR